MNFTTNILSQELKKDLEKNKNMKMHLQFLIY